MVHWSKNNLKISISSFGLDDLHRHQTAMLALIRGYGSYLTENEDEHVDAAKVLASACDILEGMLLSEDDLFRISERVSENQTGDEMLMIELARQLEEAKAKMALMEEMEPGLVSQLELRKKVNQAKQEHQRKSHSQPL